MFDTITPKEAFARMQEGAVYLDVRTPEEFSRGHAKGAVNVPLKISSSNGFAVNPNFLADAKMKIAVSKSLVVGCQAGGRSRAACEVLADNGYANLATIDGGFCGRRDPATGAIVQCGWEAEGLPCEK